MPISVGDKLGPYEILAPIGNGGNGEAYRAKDTKLQECIEPQLALGMMYSPKRRGQPDVRLFLAPARWSG
jgi:hypothetical protein